MNFERKISVVVCTYNQEKTIARALDSILSQRCSWPFEILIGEDCSTDHTRSICQDYAERHPDIIRLFANPTNRGLLNNYYDCLLQAQGKYIADLAGDDEWCDPYKLEKELSTLEEHPDVVLVHTDYRLLDSHSGTCLLAPFNVGHRGIVDGKTLTTSILTQRCRPVVHLCTAMYRNENFRKCYEEHQDLFRNPNYPCEDLQLCSLLSQQGRFAYIDAITLSYNTDISLSKTKDEVRQFDFVRRVTQLSFDLQQRLQLPMDRQMSAYYTYRLYALMMHAFRSNNPDLRHEVKKCACRWQTRPDLKTCILSFITANRFLWTIALSLRKYLLKLLRH